jgi:hypothetical protein
MTLARPVLGAMALNSAREGNWGEANTLFALAWVTDLEGYPARWFNADTDAGRVGDPIADGLLRLESLLAIGPEMPTTTAIVMAAELDTLRINKEIQSGRGLEPYVPMEAKVGTTLQASGVICTAEGLRRLSPIVQGCGEAMLLIGTGLRSHAYRRKRNEMRD